MQSHFNGEIIVISKNSKNDAGTIIHTHTHTDTHTYVPYVNNNNKWQENKHKINFAESKMPDAKGYML